MTAPSSATEKNSERSYRLMLKACGKGPEGKECRHCKHSTLMADIFTIHCKRGPHGMLWSAMKEACGCFEERA